MNIKATNYRQGLRKSPIENAIAPVRRQEEQAITAKLMLESKMITALTE